MELAASDKTGAAGADGGKENAGLVGVKGTLVRIVESGSYQVKVGDQLEIDLTVPVVFDPKNLTVTVAGDTDAVVVEENFVIGRPGQLVVDTILVGAFLGAAEPGKATVTVSLGPGKNTSEIDVTAPQ
jgi:hypothetical protein